MYVYRNIPDPKFTAADVRRAARADDMPIRTVRLRRLKTGPVLEVTLTFNRCAHLFADTPAAVEEGSRRMRAIRFWLCTQLKETGCRFEII